MTVANPMIGQVREERLLMQWKHWKDIVTVYIN